MENQNKLYMLNTASCKSSGLSCKVSTGYKQDDKIDVCGKHVLKNIQFNIKDQKKALKLQSIQINLYSCRETKEDHKNDKKRSIQYRNANKKCKLAFLKKENNEGECIKRYTMNESSFISKTYKKNFASFECQNKRRCIDILDSISYSDPNYNISKAVINDSILKGDNDKKMQITETSVTPMIDETGDVKTAYKKTNKNRNEKKCIGICFTPNFTRKPIIKKPRCGKKHVKNENSFVLCYDKSKKTTRLVKKLQFNVLKFKKDHRISALIAALDRFSCKTYKELEVERLVNRLKMFKT